MTGQGRLWFAAPPQFHLRQGYLLRKRLENDMHAIVNPGVLVFSAADECHDPEPFVEIDQRKRIGQLGEKCG